MVRNCVDYALEKLEEQQLDSMWNSPVKDQVQALQMELRMLKMFYWCFSTCQDVEEIIHALAKIDFQIDSARLELAVSVLLEKIELFKPKARDKCVGVLDCSVPRFKNFLGNPEEILQSLDSVIQNLIYVVNSKANMMIFRVKKQIQSLQEKLRFFRNLVDFMATRSDKHKDLDDFFTHIQAWAKNMVCLTILYWANHIDEKIPNFIETYFRLPKGSKSSSSSDPVVVGELVGNFVDLFLKNQAISSTDHVEILHEGLIFLISFLVDPPEEHAEDGKLILTPTDEVVNEATSLMCSLYAVEIKEDTIKERDILLSKFLEKIDTLKSEVRHFYVQIPPKLLSNSPMTNALGFITSFLGKLKEILKCKGDVFVPFAKHQVVIVQAQLESLQPFLMDLTELQNEHKEIKDLWRCIINVAYQAEHVIDSCCFIKDRPIWYSIICLSEVIEEMKLLVLEVEKIKHKKTFNPANNASEKLEWSNMLPAPTNASRIHQVVGFKDATETIIQRLKRGSAQLDIVSIVGMPGQGKTTLANKVYYDSSIEYYFHKRAWCCVSQVYQRRSVLLDILSDIIAVNVETAMSDEDLVEQLWKSLKGQRFLIVIDDIWDINVWIDLQRSFPDDNKGSRILLTSRIHSVPSKIKRGCNPQLLCPLSDEESWELMKLELQIKEDLPMHLLVLGKQIAKSCQGLPLAIIVIAGLLARKTDDMVNWWKQIAANLAQHAGEGCMGKLELSYMHLPDNLKPCFLYYGIFPEDTQIRIKKLIRFWIAEGFIQGTKTNRLEDVANEYLWDLVDRNLVKVTKRSSKGGIKSCSVHDLIRDFCLSKAKEEHFFQLVHGYDGYDVSRSSLNPIKYDRCRLGIYTDFEPFIESRPTGPRVRSLLFFHRYSRNSYYAGDIFCNFKHLRVLKMDSISLGRSFPKGIEVLAVLKYLEIQGSFTRVPSSIVNLQYLETFIVTSIPGLVLPATIWKIKSLKHVDIPRHVIFSFGNREFESSQSSNIQTLSCAIISEEVYAMKLMRRLQELQKLTCIFKISDANLKKPFPFRIFNTLSKLESLKLIGLSERMEERQFKEFTLPRTLRKLTFSRFALPGKVFSVIGQLPNLEVLKLQKVVNYGGAWDLTDKQFVNLKFLELYDMRIRKWDVSTEEPFPCLHRLVLGYCLRLEEIPSCFGYISTLKTIEVNVCSAAAKNSASQILNEQRDMGNEDLEVHIS